MQVGDRIVIEPKKAAQPGRAGVIEEVMQESPARVLVRWDDGRSSILSPAAGVARITPAKASRGRAKATAKAPAAKAPAAKAKPAAKAAASKDAAPRAKSTRAKK
jgi:hypothetical protein